MTKQLVARLYFGHNGYEFALVPTEDNRLIFADESPIFFGQFGRIREPLVRGTLKPSSRSGGTTLERGGEVRGPHYVYEAVSSWIVDHFHDTSSVADVRLQSRSTTTSSFALTLRTWRRSFTACNRRIPIFTPGSATS